MPHHQRQFGIWHLLVATLFVACVVSITPQIQSMSPRHRDLAFWLLTIAVGSYSRWIGWRLTWPLGSIGRHAVAFLAATIGCTVWFLMLNYRQSFADLLREISAVLGLSALGFGLLAAAITETASNLVSFILSDILETTNSQSTSDDSVAGDRQRTQQHSEKQ